MDLSELGAIGGVDQRAGLSVVSLGGKDGLEGQQPGSGGQTGQVGEAGVKLGLTPKLHTRAVGQQVLTESLLCAKSWLRRENRRRHCESLGPLLRVCPGGRVLDAEGSSASGPQGAS